MLMLLEKAWIHLPPAVGYILDYFALSWQTVKEKENFEFKTSLKTDELCQVILP